MSAPVFAPNVLYAVLLHRGDRRSWHCALYLPAPRAEGAGEPRGFLAHCTNKNPENRWRYEEFESPRALDIDTRLVLAARLADLSSLGPYAEVLSPVKEVLRAVKVYPYAHRTVFDCRKWMLGAIAALNEAAFVQCTNVSALESELVTAAILATPRYEQDRRFGMITTKHCLNS